MCVCVCVYKVYIQIKREKDVDSLFYLKAEENHYLIEH